jgi:hypothetical protein
MCAQSPHVLPDGRSVPPAVAAVFVVSAILAILYPLPPSDELSLAQADAPGTLRCAEMQHARYRRIAHLGLNPRLTA